jgi:hypothetical protein
MRPWVPGRGVVDRGRDAPGGGSGEWGKRLTDGVGCAE